MSARTLPPATLLGAAPRTGEAKLPPSGSLPATRDARTVPSFEQVYDQHYAYVWRCLRSLGVFGPCLDDAVQDVFLVVHDKLSAFDGAARLRTWLYAIVIRIARRYRERQAVAARRHAEQESAGGQCPQQHAEQREQLALAQQLLAQLDDGRREVFVLAEVEQMSAPEIAEVTGVPVNTVYSRLRSARLLFAQAARRAQAQDGGVR